MSPLTNLRRSRTLELLEPRLVLSSGSTLVGDAQFAFYDSQVYGTADPVFARDAPTYDSTGAFQEAGTRRFADEIAYAPPIEWMGTGVVPSTEISLRVLAAGWDHDGSTPLAVVRVLGERLDLYRGDGLTKVGSISYEQLSEAAGPGKQLVPQSAVVFNGLIVISSERRENFITGYRTVGTTFLTTQDYGQTLDTVAQVGGGTDVPPIAGGVADGIPRGRSWAFLNPFPVGDLDEPNQAWFPWVDYLDKSGQPAGGQVGLFKATRDVVGEPWTVEPNRLVFERWEPNDPTGGTHSHTAAVTTAGLVSHWGDAGYSNEILLHKFDLDAYTTAPVTTTSVFGGYDENGTLFRQAPQPVAAAPAPDPGEHFASGDFTREMVLRFGDLESGSDVLEVDGVVDRPLSTTRGVVYDGAVILHLHWMQGVGYVSSSGNPGGYGHFSANGEDWVAFNHADQAIGRVLLYGDRLLGIAGGNELALAPLPTVEVVKPLALAPGGTNLIAPSLQNRIPEDDGLSLRQVEFSAGLWRYADDGEPLDVQTEAPPFPPSTPIYEAVSNSTTATSFGSWWLQENDATADLSSSYQLEHWVANLGAQSVQLQTRLRAPSRGGGSSPIRAHQAATTGSWVALDYRGLIPYSGAGRLSAQFDLIEPAPGSRFLVAWPYLGLGNNIPYPLSPGASGPNESEALVPFEPTEKWTVAFVAAWPENASLNGRPARTLLTLGGLDNGRVEIAVEYARFSNSTDRLVVSAFKGDVLVATNVHPIQLLRDEVIEVAVSGDGASLLSTARVGSGQVTEHEVPYRANLAITNVRWGDSFGETASIEPIVISVDAHAAASLEDHRDWMHGTLRQKAIAFARHAPGDYNGDGIVDAADYTIWRGQLGTASDPGPSADSDRDGYITTADYDLWRGAYGTVVPPEADDPSDYNGDGLVDAADYTVWRDQLGTAPESGDSADGDLDGRITESDLDVWQRAYGTVVSTLDEILPAPLSDASSSTVGVGRVADAHPVSPNASGDATPASLAATAYQATLTRATSLATLREPALTAAASAQDQSILLDRASDAPRDAAFAALTGLTPMEKRWGDEGGDRDTSDDQSVGASHWNAFSAKFIDLF